MFSYEIVISSSREYYSLREENMCCHRCVPNTSVGGKTNRCVQSTVVGGKMLHRTKVITIVKPVSNTILLIIISAVKTMFIRWCQYIHMALLIYPYGPGKIFIQPCHTDQLDYLIKVLRTGCFCIGPGIDSQSAVLALGPPGLGVNTANHESIPGLIQKQPVSTYTFLPYFSYFFTIQLIFLPYFSYFFIIQLTFLLYFSYFVTIQRIFLSYLSYVFTIQVTFLLYFQYLYTIQPTFLPHFQYLFTIQLTFLPSFSYFSLFS